MDRKVDRRLRNTFQNSGDTFLAPNSSSNNMGRYVFTMDSLYHDNRYRGDGLSRKERISCQDVGHTCQQNHDDNKQAKPSVNGKFDDFSGRKGDSEIYVRGFDSQRYAINSIKEQKQINSYEESRNSTSALVVHSECSERIQAMSLSLGQLLRVDTLDGTVWIKKRPETSCHLVLPYYQYSQEKNNNSTSVCHVSANNESYEIPDYRCSHAVVVETLMKSNRCSIATSLGLKIENNDQDDFIGYIKEDLIDYIEEVREFGFEHIIVIGERYLGILFMDCFGRVFDMDCMTGVLWFHGDYLKKMKRVAKGLETDRMGWVVEPDGNIAETEDDSNMFYNLPVAKKDKKRSKKKKKNSMKRLR